MGRRLNIGDDRKRQLVRRAWSLHEQSHPAPRQALAEEFGLSVNAIRDLFYSWRRKGDAIPRFRARPGKHLPPNPDLDEVIGGDETTWEEKDNGEIEATLSRRSISQDAPTLEDVWRVFDLNAEDWIVKKLDVNTWDTQYQGVVIHLYQIHPTLVPRRPERQDVPEIKAIHVSPPTQYRAPAHARQADMKTALILSDAHMAFEMDDLSLELTEYHDRRVLSIFMQACADTQPDKILLAGDMLDLAEVSDKFLYTPNMERMVQPALLELHWFIHQLRLLCPHSEIVLFEGNHDERIIRSILKNQRWVYNLKPAGDLTGAPAISIPRLLSLDQLDVPYVDNYPDGVYWLNHKIAISHGTIIRKQTGHTIAAMLQHAQHAEIVGHVHRIELGYLTRHPKKRPTTYGMGIFGCACHLDGRVPHSGRSRDLNWQQGFGKITYLDGGSNIYTLTPYPIFGDAGCIFNGKQYFGTDYKEDLVDAYPEYSLFKQYETDHNAGGQ